MLGTVIIATIIVVIVGVRIMVCFPIIIFIIL